MPPLPQPERGEADVSGKEGLTPRQQLFVIEYLKDPNGKKAAMTAGYKFPAIAASNLLNPQRYPNVARAIYREYERKRTESRIEVQDLLKILLRVAMFNPKELFHPDGKPKKLSELPDEVAMCLKKVYTKRSIQKAPQGPQSGPPGKRNKLVPAKVVYDHECEWDSRMDAIKQIAQLLGFTKEANETYNLNIGTANVLNQFDWGDLTQKPKVVDVIEQRIQAERLGIESLPDKSEVIENTNDEE